MEKARDFRRQRPLVSRLRAVKFPDGPAQKQTIQWLHRLIRPLLAESSFQFVFPTLAQKPEPFALMIVVAELAQYYQSVSRVDQGIGRLIAILQETGQWENTLFLYLSDNGAAFPGSKTTLYEPGMRLPLIVRSPAAPQTGVRNDALVSWVDLAPTILDFAGALDDDEREPLRHRAVQSARPAPKGFHGRSFLELIGRTTGAGRDEVFASHTFHEITMYYPMRVARTRQFKYILNLAHQLPYPFASDLWVAPTWQSIHRAGGEFYGQRKVADFIQRPREELYNVEADPFEARNLAADPEFARTLETLRARAKHFMETTGDPWVVKWDYE